MNARTKKILEEALELSAEDRAFLAVALEASLDDSSEIDDERTPEEIEQAWAEELQRRVSDVIAGRSHARPAAEAVAELRARLRASRLQ